MKIYYTCSTAEFDKYRDYYFDIRNFIVSSGHLLTRDWLPHTEQRLNIGHKDIRDIKTIYKECMIALRDAELVIIEDTVSNFSSGHQITLALQQRKPTLVLWQGKKHRQFNQMFIHGIDSDLLQVSEYTNNKYKEIIKTFIAKNEGVHDTNRFHLVINNAERQYLDWAQYEKNKSRTKIVKEALKMTIDNDAEYNKYLNEKT